MALVTNCIKLYHAENLPTSKIYLFKNCFQNIQILLNLVILRPVKENRHFRNSANLLKLLIKGYVIRDDIFLIHVYLFFHLIIRVICTIQPNDLLRNKDISIEVFPFHNVKYMFEQAQNALKSPRTHTKPFKYDIKQQMCY